MTGLQLDRESVTLHEPVTLTCKVKADPELVLKCQRLGERPYRGVRLGKLRETYPTQALKRILLDEARTFTAHMKRQGYEPREAETEMRLYGPFREKLDMGRGAALENFEAGNHLIPQGMWRSAAHGTGRATERGVLQLDRERVLGSQDWRRGVAFLIKGQFLAAHGKEEETTGILIAGG